MTNKSDNAIHKFDLAYSLCRSVDRFSLADYVKDYFAKSPEELACMPGTPSQVMTAQFILHTRLAVELVEVYSCDTKLFSQVVDIILRSPSARSRKTVSGVSLRRSS